MASTKDNHAVVNVGTVIDTRPFPEIAKSVKSGHCNYRDILDLFNFGAAMPDEAENLEVTELLCGVLDSKIAVPLDFGDKLKIDACVWLGICVPPLFSPKKWKRDLALKQIGYIRKLIPNIELSQQENWESLRNILLRHVDALLDMVCEHDKHWCDVWIIAIDILGNRLALNTNRPLLNKLFKVLSPFKEDFQKFPALQGAVREVPFKLATVACWRKVVDYWLHGPADVPLNHVTTIIRFFKRLDAEPPVIRAKCVVIWRVICLLPPGHKGIQPSIDQLFAMLLNRNTSKALSKAAPAPGFSNLELVPDVLSEMVALLLGAHLRAGHGLVFNAELLLPTHELIGANSTFLQKIFQCFEKLLLIDPASNANKPNIAAIKAGFGCFLSKLVSNPSNELINSVLKLPQYIVSQARDTVAVLNNSVDIVVWSVVCGPYCFGDNIMTSSKYYSGSTDLMTGSPTLMLTRYLLGNNLALYDTDIVLSILEVLIPKGVKTVHYVRKTISLLQSLGTDESISFLTVLKVWQTLVISINTQYCKESDFIRETPDLSWIYSVILFPLNCFNDQYSPEIANYVRSTHQLDLYSKLLTNNASAENSMKICEGLAFKLDKLLSAASASCIPVIVAATHILTASTPFSRIPRGNRYLKATFTLVANLLAVAKTSTCLTEGIAVELVKTLEALAACLDGYLPSLLSLTSLVTGLLRLPLINKHVTNLVLTASHSFIEMAEKEYGNNAVPSVTKLKAAHQYCQIAAKAEETQSCVFTPKRSVPFRRITPKRVGPTPSPVVVTGGAEREASAVAEAPKAERMSTKKLNTAQPSSPAAEIGPAQPAKESDPKLAPPKQLASAGRTRGPLTKHQREKMRERRDNIPALYVDLTQESLAVADSQPELTQDSSSLVIPQRFKVSAAETETPSKVESRPFASVVQEPAVAKDDSGKAGLKERTKDIYDIFRKDKKIVLPPIHLKKVHLPKESSPLKKTGMPEEIPAVSQDRPFQAFSPANKKKQELSKLAAAEATTPPHAVVRKCLLPEAPASQDIIADSQRAETPPLVRNDDGIAVFPPGFNSPVRSPSQRKAPKKSTLDFLWDCNAKRKSLKGSDSESNQSLSKKQNLTVAEIVAPKKSSTLTALPSFVDESSNTSTDSTMSASRKIKRNELSRLRSDLILNELPTKRARRSQILSTSNLESNVDITGAKHLKKSQAQNSDCDSVTSEASSTSDISITKKRTRRSQLLPTTEDDLLQLKKFRSSLSVEELQQPSKPIEKLKSISSVGKNSVADPVPPMIEEQNKKDIVKNTLVIVVDIKNMIPSTVKIARRSLRKNVSANRVNTKNSIPASIAKVTPKENSQNVLEDENLQRFSMIPVLPLVSTLEDSTHIAENYVASTIEAVPSPTDIPNKPQEQFSVPLVCLDSDVVDGATGTEICPDLVANNIPEKLESNGPMLDIECMNMVSNKENKIVEESQDSIIPSSQSEFETSKSIAAKRKYLRPRILSRSFTNSEPKTVVLSSVSVIPETQILDTEIEPPSLIQEPVAEPVVTNEPCSLEQQHGHSEPALPEKQTAQDMEVIPSSNTVIQTLMPELTRESPAICASEHALELVEYVPDVDNEVVCSPLKEEPEEEVAPMKLLPTELPPMKLPLKEISLPMLIPLNDVPPKEVELPPMNISLTVVPPKEVLPTELPTIELPPIELPPIELPSIELPPIELPPIEMPLTEVSPMEKSPTKVLSMPPTEMHPMETPPTEMLPTKMPPKEVREAAVGGSELGEDMKSPPRPGPKVMENLSPSMLRLLNSTHAQKAIALEPTCRSKKMLQMVFPLAQDTSMRVKPPAEKQEACIYIDQTFPAQECLLGDDGTPVLRDWKKCVPSPSSVPARSSMKGSVQKNKSGNRKLSFPFEPTTKVLYYYEKKNLKCNENISSMKIKKRLRKKRKSEQEKQEMPSSIQALSTTLESVPMVHPSNAFFSTKCDSTSMDESLSSINGSHLPNESGKAQDKSAASSPHIVLELPDNAAPVLISPTPLPLALTISETEISKAEEMEPAISDNIELIVLTDDTPMVSTSQEIESPANSNVILAASLLTSNELNPASTSISEPAAVLNAPAESATLFEDSYHEYVTPTPLSLPDPELLNSTDPLYADLAGCQQPIAFMVPSLTTPQWHEDLTKELAERNIVTVGDFCRRTERQIELLPIKGNKIKTALRALDKYKTRLQIADACAKDLLKGLECNNYSKDVFDKLYPSAKNSVNIAETQTCSELEDNMHDNFIKNASADRLFKVIQESGKLFDDGFVENLVKKIEPRKYISLHCNSSSVDDLSLELANSINLLPSEVRMRHINTLLSHLKFKD